MPYVIAEPCIGVKDTACVDACPVDCIHPRSDEGLFAESPQLYIDAEHCICCGACVPVCPVSAIFLAEDLPLQWKKYVQTNAAQYAADAAPLSTRVALDSRRWSLVEDPAMGLRDPRSGGDARVLAYGMRERMPFPGA